MLYSGSKEYLYYGIAAIILSFVISFLITPIARKISLKHGFYASPNHRSSHFQKVPNTGGILLFFSIVIPVYTFLNGGADNDLLLLAISFLVLFIVGVLDDLINVSVRFKLAGQFLPAVLILLSLKTQGFILPFIPASVDFPMALKFTFWVVVVVGIINAYNFIDGIDGLAIGLGVFGGLVFGTYFFMNHYFNLATLGFSLSGGLLGLLYFNLSKSRKIFIGDTGSLIIGGIISLFVLRHLEINASDNLNFSSSMIFGVLFIPVSDLVRVVVTRLLSKRSPFNADRSHIHHVIIDKLKLSHRRTSVFILAIQAIIFLLFLAYNELFSKGQILFSLGMFLIYFATVEWIRKKQG